MKIHHFILLTSLFAFNVNCQSNPSKNKDNLIISKDIQSIEKIEILEQSRGINKSFVLNSTQKIATINGNKINKVTEIDEWSSIITEVNKINVSQLSSYIAPTDKRYSDAAMATTIKITLKGKEYSSNSFDAGNPPKELAALYKILKEQADKIPNPSRSNF